MTEWRDGPDVREAHNVGGLKGKAVCVYNNYKSRMAYYSMWLLGRDTRTNGQISWARKAAFRPSIPQLVRPWSCELQAHSQNRARKADTQTGWTKQLVAWNEQT